MYQNYNDISYAESPFGTLSQYMTKTFGWMFAGLLVTFAVGIGTVTSGLVYLLAGTGLIFLTSIAELVMVFVLSARITKLQPSTATGLFFGYAVLNGINLSTIFLVYDVGSLVLAFLVGAVYFGVMAVYVQPPAATSPAGVPNSLRALSPCWSARWWVACSACSA